MEKVLEIINAVYLHDYWLHIVFNNSEAFDVDLSVLFENDFTGVFQPLREKTFFREFYVDYTLCWKNDIDVAPEYIYFLANKNNPAYQSLFKEWGYIE